MSRKIGIELRSAIRSWCQSSGVSFRELSRRIGKEPNYLACYLSRDPDAWIVPKAPTFDRILKEIGVSEKELCDDLPVKVEAAE